MKDPINTAILPSQPVINMDSEKYLLGERHGSRRTIKQLRRGAALEELELDMDFPGDHNYVAGYMVGYKLTLKKPRPDLVKQMPKKPEKEKTGTKSGRKNKKASETVLEKMGLVGLSPEELRKKGRRWAMYNTTRQMNDGVPKSEIKLKIPDGLPKEFIDGATAGEGLAAIKQNSTHGLNIQKMHLEGLSPDEVHEKGRRCAMWHTTNQMKKCLKVELLAPLDIPEGMPPEFIEGAMEGAERSKSRFNPDNPSKPRAVKPLAKKPKIIKAEPAPVPTPTPAPAKEEISPDRQKGRVYGANMTRRRLKNNTYGSLDEIRLQIPAGKSKEFRLGCEEGKAKIWAAHVNDAVKKAEQQAKQAAELQKARDAERLAREMEEKKRLEREQEEKRLRREVEEKERLKREQEKRLLREKEEVERKEQERLEVEARLRREQEKREEARRQEQERQEKERLQKQQEEDERCRQEEARRQAEMTKPQPAPATPAAPRAPQAQKANSSEFEVARQTAYDVTLKALQNNAKPELIRARSIEAYGGSKDKLAGTVLGIEQAKEEYARSLVKEATKQQKKGFMSTHGRKGKRR